jgi:hypothetical protein
MGYLLCLLSCSLLAVLPAHAQQAITPECHDMLATGRTMASWEGYHQLALDTLKRYVETCYSEDESWKAFTSMKGPVQWMGEEDPAIYSRQREWLLAVLYYNPDTMYYCEDVFSIVHTMRRNGDRGYDVNGMMSVWKYIIEENRCPYVTDMLASGWEDGRHQQRLVYDDTVTDRELYPLDTTLLTLEELGLELLRGPKGAVVNEGVNGQPGILSFTASSNPFKTETTLNFTLGSKELISLSIHSVLGEEVFSTGIGKVYEIGDHQIPLFAEDLPSGTLYARLTTLGGEVRTVKLIKY